MRIYELNPILDEDILGSQVLALDDSTQTRKISLDQIRKFLGVGENSTLIPSGTDIHVYFMTAKSGSYYGEGLVNTAHGGAWAAFDWTTHDQGRGTLTETNNVNELAVHSLAAGAWTKKKIISESGGTFLGKVTIKSNAEVLALTNVTLNAALYLLGRDADGTSRYSIGVVSDNSNDLAITNYKGGSNGILLQENGGIVLSTIGSKPVITNGLHEITSAAPQLHFVESDTGKKYIFVADGGEFRLDEDSTAGVSAWRWVTTTKILTVGGQVIPTNYANFDARYYTQSGANAKFVQGVQLGAQVVHTPPGNEVSWTFDCPTGNMLTGIVVQETGNGSADNIGGMRHKPIQRNINGVWATIPG